MQGYYYSLYPYDFSAIFSIENNYTTINFLVNMNKPSAYTFVLDGNILISRVVGTLTLRDTQRAFSQLKVQVSQFAGAPWANLIDIRQWGLNAADVDEALIELETWVRKNGRTHRVFVIGTEYAEIKRFTLEKYLGNRLQKEQENMVATEAEALTWLSQYGFHLQSGK